jgi:hypothetical protein
MCLYAIEAAAIIQVLRRFNWDPAAAAADLGSLSVLPRKMFPVRMRLYERLRGSRVCSAKKKKEVSLPRWVKADVMAASPAPGGVGETSGRVGKAPAGSANTIVPGPWKASLFF